MTDPLQTLLSSFSNEKDRAFLEEALDLQSQAEREGLRLRLLGSLAFRLQCPEYSAHFEALERRLTDIDFAASTTDRERLLPFFRQRGYAVDENALYLGGGYRYIFENPRNKMHLDIFFDRLEMCHTVNFKDRLHLDNRTLSLTDLLLEKMQIVTIGPKDFKDVAILLLQHGVGHDDRSINGLYIADLLSRDWGFHHTVVTNLGKLRDVAAQWSSLDSAEKARLNERIEALLTRINRAEKTLAWKARARLGTRVPWYRHVD